MKRIINVYTGEVKAGGKDLILKSNGIGSCVVVAAYDSIKKVGALAHVMVHGAAPKDKVTQQTRYAANAINEMIEQMTILGADKDNIETCLIGGGNVLKRVDDTICQNNISSVLKILHKKGLKIRKKAVGGTARRTVLFDIENGAIYYTENNSQEMLLWKSDNKVNIKKKECFYEKLGSTSRWDEKIKQ